MTASARVDLPGGARAFWSDATAGDLRPAGPGGDGPLVRLATDVGAPGAVLEVHWLEQVHGRAVVVVGAGRDSPSEPRVHRSAIRAVADGPGDALVSASSQVALCVLVADCAPLALASPEGVFAAVHVGWRGVRDGVVGAAVEAMRALGASSVRGALGPCIHPCCYEFSEGDLATVVEALGPAVRNRTEDGGPALDLPVATASALSRVGGEMVVGIDRCTGCGDGLFSHRARGESERQAMLVWRPEAAADPGTAADAAER